MRRDDINEAYRIAVADLESALDLEFETLHQALMSEQSRVVELCFWNILKYQAQLDEAEAAVTKMNRGE